MQGVRKSATLKRRMVRTPSQRGNDRAYTLTCRVLGFDRQSTHQTLLYADADGHVARQIDVPTALITRAGVGASHPDVVVYVREYDVGGFVMHFTAGPRVRDGDLPHAVRTIVMRKHDRT